MLADCQINNFVFVSQIGSGAYGVVYRAVDITTDKCYAIKSVIKPSSFNPVNSISATGNLKKGNVLLTQLYHYFKTFQNKLFLPTTDLQSIRDLSQEQLQATVPHYREIALHLKVQDHENIVTVHQVLESPLATFIVMDYYPTDLFTSIVEHQHFAKDGLLIKKVYLQLCSALQHCHQLGIYHCDIKPENILLDDDDNVYLCDFGLATTSDHLAPNVCVGSSYYMAPERVLCVNPNDLFPTATGDVWSIGIILINLVCIRNPWSKAHQNDERTFHYFTKDSTILKKILPISDELYSLLAKILKIDPYERIDITSLMYEVSQITSFTKEGWLNTVPPLTSSQYRKYIYCNSNNSSVLSENEKSNEPPTIPRYNSPFQSNSIRTAPQPFTPNKIVPLLPGDDEDNYQHYPPQVPKPNCTTSPSSSKTQSSQYTLGRNCLDNKVYNVGVKTTDNSKSSEQTQYHPFSNSLPYLQMNLPTVTNRSTDSYW
ncbi:hypothetical protein TPHA_0L01240 [Tetrapisispora phaffii CBS 4417]|uniref:Protein kinase domain-containing protein n=1 Tax=Tetrapisispora phaffii (strain ATCC 24235 / CBS 4417 / NBRC 1672 / NRRL Y-8282 / UCD 70-5) TaxID=1071381 RepID=G8C003_TETPH|nr:hypothetical protein TPHA_0L01240 [Tetrapisispora phaffii CBS 4417]CCE65481.1 hypothetical protein TPHA_0L01240 [Tetrapisispora phaffii CBS 4417]